MQRIRQVSLFFRVLLTLILILMPITQIIGWINAPQSYYLFHFIYFNMIPQGYEVLHMLSISERLMGFGVSMLPVSIEMFIVYCLIRLFRLYEQGHIFTLDNVRYIRYVGYALFADQLAQVIYGGLMGLVVTWNNPHGHRLAKITFDQTNAGLLLVAFLVVLVSWVMAEGYKLQQEQQLTI